MREHSYHQYCPIAHALDLVGDRWALLIVRDLYLGPKRFTDLKGGLPGLGTNILTARLKALERAGVVTRRALPFPAAATVYELTAYGQKLGATLGTLARWGGETLGPPEEGQAITLDSIMLTASGLFRTRPHAVPRATYAVHVATPAQSATFGVSVEDGVVSVSRDAPEQADVAVWTDIASVVGVVGGRLSLREAVERGVVRLEGDAAAIAGLLASDAGTSAVA